MANEFKVKRGLLINSDTFNGTTNSITAYNSNDTNIFSVATNGDLDLSGDITINSDANQIISAERLTVGAGGDLSITAPSGLILEPASDPVAAGGDLHLNAGNGNTNLTLGAVAAGNTYIQPGSGYSSGTIYGNIYMATSGGSVVIGDTTLTAGKTLDVNGGILARSVIKAVTGITIGTSSSFLEYTPEDIFEIQNFNNTILEVGTLDSSGDEFFRFFGGGVAGNKFEITSTGNVLIDGSVVIGDTTLTAEGLLHLSDSNYTNLPFFERTGTGTNTFLSTARFIATTSADMVDDFGAGIDFAIRDSADVYNGIAAIGAVRDGADNTGAIVFRTLLTGTSDERARITSNGLEVIGTGRIESTAINPDPALHVDNILDHVSAHAQIDLDKGNNSANASVRVSSQGSTIWDFGAIDNNNFTIRNSFGYRPIVIENGGTNSNSLYIDDVGKTSIGYGLDVDYTAASDTSWSKAINASIDITDMASATGIVGISGVSFVRQSSSNTAMGTTQTSCGGYFDGLTEFDVVDQASSWQVGIIAKSTTLGSQDISNAKGVYTRVEIQGAGDMVNAYGLYSEGIYGNSTGRSTNYYGVYSDSAVTSGLGTGTFYHFYGNGDYPSYLGGDLEVGGDINIASLTASQVVETDASKNLVSVAKGTAYNKAFGTGSGDVCEGNDGRLSDARTPTSHNNTYHSETYITSAGVTYENLNTNSDVGTGASQVAAGNHTHTSFSNLSITGELDISGNIKDEFTAGETVAAGDLCYYKSDSKMWKADASAEATSKGMLAIAGEAVTASSSGTFYLWGPVTTTGLTAADVLYVSETAAGITGTAPTTASAVVRVIGYALSTTSFLFKPDNTWVTV